MFLARNWQQLGTDRRRLPFLMRLQLRVPHPQKYACRCLRSFRWWNVLRIFAPTSESPSAHRRCSRPIDQSNVEETKPEKGSRSTTFFFERDATTRHRGKGVSLSALLSVTLDHCPIGNEIVQSAYAEILDLRRSPFLYSRHCRRKTPPEALACASRAARAGRCFDGNRKVAPTRSARHPSE